MNQRKERPQRISRAEFYMYLHGAGLQSGRNFEESHTNQADGVVTRNSAPGSEDFASEQKKIGTWIPKTGAKSLGTHDISSRRGF